MLGNVAVAEVEVIFILNTSFHQRPGEIHPTLNPGASVFEKEEQSRTMPFLSKDFAAIARFLRCLGI